ncbi:Methyltransferase domain-containing protein [Sphingomonas laterariae]|uniref:Methyltransferase domain-containing protein n=2 Tax=Edaphosphingomonas laterariae TaxID=861865 RepID=A0A239J0R8_9SPHN|nr:Methyltransferase domain-containing protein [Sphingomonas laterariae]
MPPLSARLQALVAALPLRPGLRVLEIGCGPGAAARDLCRRIGGGTVLAIDRSPRAIAQAIAASGPEIASGQLTFRSIAIEDFALAAGEPPFDLAFAFRVGAFDGRHPERFDVAIGRLRAALAPGAPFFIDGGAPLRAIDLSPKCQAGR